MNAAEILERPCRDLAAEELWRRSLARSLERRALARAGEATPRSIVSVGIPDLDAPAEFRPPAPSTDRDLSDENVWDLSLACAKAKRRAADKGVLPQARVASASLVVAAVAALAPTHGGAHPRASSGGGSVLSVSLLKLGSRGDAVAKVQRALGIKADGVFGPKTRAAVVAFQKRNGLAADGVVGPKTRGALFGQDGGSAEKLIRAWWVAPVQRALGVPADGVYGPQTRAAVRAYQAKKGLVVDGVVGPQTLASLGITGGAGNGGGGVATTVSNTSHSHGNGPGSVSRTLWDELTLAKSMGLRLVSGHRPGSTIGGSGRSDHSYYPSRAIDVGGSPAAMRRFALAAAGRPGIRYVIYSPLGMWGSWNGAWKAVSGGTLASHYDHVHVSGSG